VINIDGIKSELGFVDGVEISKGSLEDCWLKFKTALTYWQRRFIALVKYRMNSKVPWLNYMAFTSIKRSSRPTYRKYKESTHPACRQASRKDMVHDLVLSSLFRLLNSVT